MYEMKLESHCTWGGTYLGTGYNLLCAVYQGVRQSAALEGKAKAKHATRGQMKPGPVEIE